MTPQERSALIDQLDSPAVEGPADRQVMRHTPGPWHLGGTFQPGTPDVHCTVWSAPLAGYASGDEVAKYVHPRDAHLIAAAPNLLSAMEKINEWCCYASEENIDARLTALQQISIHARAAIATTVASAA